MNTHVFKITAKTNLHVGNESGGEFTIIDKAIQRDPLTNLPCINSSSLKGSIKEFCVHKNEELKKENKNSIPIKDLFGSDVDPQTGKVLPDNNKGNAIFFDAKLLYLPQQDDNTMYHYETTNNVVEMMINRVKMFNSNFNYEVESNIGDKPVIVIEDYSQFEAKCSDNNLPIIARNVLENGESKNLWYEQVLPAETVLYTIIQENAEDLKKALDGNIIQIGANATIGYGYCFFECINTKEE